MSPAAKLVPGSFCWFELATLDQEAAKRFYQSVFGWAADDQPIGPTEKYSMFRINGHDVAAGYTMRAEQKTQGVPPNWMVYVLVADADKTAARARQLGATIHAEPFDVMDSGRMSVIQDPVGAMFCIWQAAKHAGVGLKGDHGTAVWVDLSTPDQTRSGKFYSDLFGWKMTEGKSMKPAKPGDYFHIVNGTEFIGGIQPGTHRDPNAPSSWLTYFDVADADGTVKQVKSLGGRVIMPTMAMGDVRKFAVLADPQSAVFAIVQELGGQETSAKPKPAEGAAPKKAVAKKATKAKARRAKPVKKSKPAKKAARKSKPAKASAKRSAKKPARKSKPARKGQRKR
jgi:uncharacterized protein